MEARCVTTRNHIEHTVKVGEGNDLGHAEDSAPRTEETEAIEDI